MLRKLILPAVVAILAAVLTPSTVNAYGAARVGYAHVGPYGASYGHATAVRGPSGGGGYHYSSGGSYGGASYHAGGGGYQTAGGAQVGGGYHYSASYGGTTAVGGVTGGGAHYSYVR